MKRLIILLAVFAMLPAGLVPARVARAQHSETAASVLRAAGHPKRIDFLTLVNKRADLRMKVAKHGVDSAFTQWLRTEQPVAYRAEVKRLAALHNHTGKACCTTDAACCKPGATCCAPTASCCKPDAACCKSTTACCKLGAACCQPDAACCKSQTACCVKANSASNCCTQESCCAQGACCK